MALEFSADTPKGVDPKTLEVSHFGKDTKTGDYIECRITHQALMECFGADGTKPAKLLHAFEKNRQRIEEAAQRKYDLGKFQQKSDRILLRLRPQDFSF